MRKLFLYPLLTLFLFPCALLAQTITGTLVDQKTGEPLVFANVQVGDNYGVITNDEGVFSLRTDRFSETDSIKFSTLGYASKSFLLKDFDRATVRLEEKRNHLESVYLTNKTADPMVVMQRFAEHKAENYTPGNYRFQVFSRRSLGVSPHELNTELKKTKRVEPEIVRDFNREANVFSQTIVGMTSSVFTDRLSEVCSQGNDLKVNEQKSTRLINLDYDISFENLQNNMLKKLGETLKSRSTFKLKTGILNIEDSLDFSKKGKRIIEVKNDEPTSASVLASHLKKTHLGTSQAFDFLTDWDNYDYSMQGVAGFEDEMAYIISFTPGNRKALYEGTLFISADSYAVLKMEYRLAKNRVADKVNLKLLLGFKAVENVHSGIVIYQNTGEGYFPRYIRNHTNQYIYFNRSFSLTENTSRKNRMKMKLDFLLETDVGAKEELLITELRSAGTSDYTAFDEGEKAPVETLKKYDPALWQNHTIIAPNDAILNFEY